MVRGPLVTQEALGGAYGANSPAGHTVGLWCASGGKWPFREPAGHWRSLGCLEACWSPCRPVEEPLILRGSLVT